MRAGVADQRLQPVLLPHPVEPARRSVGQGGNQWQRESEPDQIRSGYVWIEQEEGWDLVAHNLIDDALARLMIDTAQAPDRTDRADCWEVRAISIADECASDHANRLLQETSRSDVDRVDASTLRDEDRLYAAYGKTWWRGLLRQGSAPQAMRNL